MTHNKKKDNPKHIVKNNENINSFDESDDELNKDNIFISITNSNNSNSSKDSKKSNGNIEIIKLIKKISSLKTFTKNNKEYSMEDILENIKYKQFSNIECEYEIELKKLENHLILGYVTKNDIIFFIIVNSTKDILYIGFNNIPFLYWYTVKTYDQYKKIINLYGNAEYKNKNDYKNNVRFYIGNKDKLNIDFYKFQQYFLLNKYTTKLIWSGSDICPMINYLNDTNKKNKYSSHDLVTTTQILVGDDNNLYVYSKYSKSLIKLEYYKSDISNNIYDYYIIDISYDDIDLNNIKCPSDVISILNNFVLQSQNDIYYLLKEAMDLSEKESILPLYYVDIFVSLIKDKNILYEKLLKIINNDNNESLKNYISEIINKVKIDIEFDKTKTEIFKKIDNDIDKIIKNIYKQYENSNIDIDLNNGDNSFYLNYKIKKTLKKIIDGKLL